LLSSPAWAVVHENLHRLIELLNLQWLLQNRGRTDLKNPIEDLAIRVTSDHDNVEVRINLLGCFTRLSSICASRKRSRRPASLLFSRELSFRVSTSLAKRLRIVFMVTHH
jgi:hypothetical protein